MKRRRHLPLVYSCSGCSNVAQLANHLAVRLDREGRAEMSCIAGLGGDVGLLVSAARGRRPIVVIDGCRHECARQCLARHGIAPALHQVLTGWGVRRQASTDFEAEQAERLYARLLQLLPPGEASAASPAGSSRLDQATRPGRARTKGE